MALSERQMLMLDSFMYADIAPGQTGKTIEELIAPYMDSSGNVSQEKIQAAVDNNQLHLSGDFGEDGPARLKDVMEKMLADNEVKNLIVGETTKESYGSIRAAAFIDSSGDVTVAFRGTGGTFRQWSNNFEGYGDLDQETQRDAKAFIDSLPYDQVDVTGHSNGANQAMFVAIVCGDKVRKCVCYEGQGFSNEFMMHYAKEVLASKKKITNICGDGDFVSPIMLNATRIGKTKYIPNSDSKLIGLHHGTYELLKRADDNNGFDENGNFKSDYYTGQNLIPQAIHIVTVEMALLSEVPFVGENVELFADIVGIGIALWFDRKNLDKSSEHYAELMSLLTQRLIESLEQYAKGILSEFYKPIMQIIEVLDVCIKNIGDFLYKHFNAGYKYASSHGEIIVDTAKLRSYAEHLYSVNQRLINLDDRMGALYKELSLLEQFELQRADMSVGSDKFITRSAEYLNSAADLFESAENEIVAQLG